MRTHTHIGRVHARVTMMVFKNIPVGIRARPRGQHGAACTRACSAHTPNTPTAVPTPGSGYIVGYCVRESPFCGPGELVAQPTKLPAPGSLPLLSVSPGGDSHKRKSPKGQSTCEDLTHGPWPAQRHGAGSRRSTDRARPAHTREVSVTNASRSFRMCGRFVKRPLLLPGPTYFMWCAGAHAHTHTYPG